MANPDRLRIAIVTETFPPEINGVAMTIGRVVDGLVRRGHQVELVRPRQGSGDEPRQADGMEELLVAGFPIPGYAGLRVGLPCTAALARRWSARPPDIVHVVTEGPLGWTAVNAARRLRLPVTSDYHTHFARYSRHYGFGWINGLIEAYLRHLHNRADLTMVPTVALARELQDHGYEDVAVVARGVSVDLYSPEQRSQELRSRWGVAEHGVAVLHVGRLAPEKNIALVLKSFDAMRVIHSDLRLVFVGDGPQRRGLERRHPEHVFAGMRCGPDLAAHYASGDVFLFPSLTETFGNVTLEALASGLGVVAYDYAAAAEVIHHERSGLLAPLDDEECFVAAACRLVCEPGLLASLRNGARSATLALDWERIHTTFVQALAELVGEHRSEPNTSLPLLLGD